jgi:23S rRNA pseudoU1915 N3-methylase RlmH
MNETLQYVLIVIGISIPMIVVALIEYYSKREKTKAETEEIKLKNEITKNITYEQLQKENKQKDIKGKIDILQSVIVLEEQIKSKKDKTSEDLKKLESLEMIKKEFKQSFEEEKNPNLVEKKPETKKRISKKKI